MTHVSFHDLPLFTLLTVGSPFLFLLPCFAFAFSSSPYPCLPHRTASLASLFLIIVLLATLIILFK